MTPSTPDRGAQLRSALRTIVDAFPEFDRVLSEAHLAAWCRALEHRDGDLFAPAADLVVNRLSRAPRIAEFHDAIDELERARAGIPTPGAAWANAWQSRSRKADAHPVVRSAVFRLGGFGALTVENRSNVSAQFRRVFEEVVREWTDARRLPPSVRDAMSETTPTDHTDLVEEEVPHVEPTAPEPRPTPAPRGPVVPDTGGFVVPDNAWDLVVAEVAGRRGRERADIDGP